MSKKFFNYNNPQNNIKKVETEVNETETLESKEIETEIVEDKETETPVETTEEIINASETIELSNDTEEVEDKEVETEEMLVKGFVNCSALNVRKEASKSSEVVTKILKDTELTILSSDLEGFYKVLTSDGIEGYCVKDFIDIK